jgi:hypothetical protein
MRCFVEAHEAVHQAVVSRRHQSAPASRSRARKPEAVFLSQLAQNNLSHPLFRNSERVTDRPQRRARFPCPRNRPAAHHSCCATPRLRCIRSVARGIPMEITRRSMLAGAAAATKIITPSRPSPPAQPRAGTLAVSRHQARQADDHPPAQPLVP